MCHEYGMRWWRSERSEKKPTEAKPDLMGIFAVPQPGEPVASPATALETEPAPDEKEFAPAK
jgi:hypothetical protein